MDHGLRELEQLQPTHHANMNNGDAWLKGYKVDQQTMKITQLCFIPAPGSSVCFKAGKAAASMSFCYRNLSHQQPFASHGCVRDIGLLRSWHILRFQSFSRQKQPWSFLHLHRNLPLLLRTSSAWGQTFAAHWEGDIGRLLRELCYLCRVRCQQYLAENLTPPGTQL